MTYKEKEDRLNLIWQEAPRLEQQQQIVEALELWREALQLKQDLGITGSGDVGELNGIKGHVDRLTQRIKGLRQ